MVADASEMRAAWRLLGGVPCVLERALDLQAEVSVVVARTPDGGFAAYPVAENVHVNGDPRPDRRPGPRPGRSSPTVPSDWR